VERWVTDVRYAWRTLSRRPGFTAATVLTLGLGVGANTAIFSAVNAVLLRRPMLADPDRLVVVWETDAQHGTTRELAAPANIADWRAGVSAFRDVTAYGMGAATVGGDGWPEVVTSAHVEGNFFAVAGVRAAHGRTLRDEETWGDVAPVVVLSDALWARRYGRDPGIVGTVITIDEVAREVVGIMAAGFTYPDGGVELWLPLGWDRSSPQRSWYRYERVLRAIARLHDDATLERANAELQAVTLRLQEEYPRTNAGVGAGVTPLQEFQTSETRAALLILLGASSLTLLLACVNIANLLLARANGREREMALRAALGARRSRIAGQLLIESLVLALLGGAAGIGTAMLGVRALHGLRPPALLRLDSLVIDARVLAFALAVTLITGLLFGLAPAWRAASSRASAALAGGVRGTDGRGQRRVSQALVVAEIALAVLLVTAAGLLLRSFIALRSIEPGFRIEDRIVASVLLPRRYDSDARQIAFADELAARAAAIPGVQSVTYASRLPFTGTTTPPGGFSIEGRAERQQEAVGSRTVAANWFDVMGVPLLRGRTFRESDDAGAEPVIVVNERMARHYFAGDDPVGRRVTWDERPGASARWYRIVGVVGDERQNGLHVQPQMETFLPLRQLPAVRLRLIVHTRADIATITPALRSALADVDAQLPLAGVQTLREMYADQFGRDRILLALTVVFAIIALLLATVGVYGLMAGMVVRRTREIGIRIALGAAAADVARMILRRGMGLTALGIAIGLPGAWVSARLLSAVLFGVAPNDPLTFAAVAALLAVAAAAACMLPALRAARLQPNVALRHD